MQQPKMITFIIPYLGGELIHDCLRTLYKYTPQNYYVYIVDQSAKGLDPNLRDKYKNLMIIRSPLTDQYRTGNLGHSKATNLVIPLVQTPYLCMLNDDVSFISNHWFQGVLDTFEKVEKASPTRPALLVNVGSIKLPDWSVGKPKGEDHYILPFKEEYTDEDWNFLANEEHYVNEHLTIMPGSVIDGINLYCSVVDTKKLLEVGLLDEYFFPGSANDYDLGCRASMFGYRCVGTTLSWVFHHWSTTFRSIEEGEDVASLAMPELHHGDLKEKWGTRLNKKGEEVPIHDLWGVRCTQCDEILHTDDGQRAVCPKHPDEIYAIPENTITPL